MQVFHLIEVNTKLLSNAYKGWRVSCSGLISRKGDMGWDGRDCVVICLWYSSLSSSGSYMPGWITSSSRLGPWLEMSLRQKGPDSPVLWLHNSHEECGAHIFSVEMLLKVILLNLSPHLYHSVPFSLVLQKLHHVFVHTMPVKCQD